MSGLVVHEWAERSGGAENVVDQMLKVFPDADLNVLWNDAPDRYPGAVESWLARTPLRRHKALAMPLMLPTWRLIRATRAYDWILVSSHLFAHHVALRSSSMAPPKYVYAHSPARYIWAPEHDDRGTKLSARVASPLFKRIDRIRAQEPEAIAANSLFVRQRIADAWDRDSEVIYPPVDVERIGDVQAWESRLTSDERRLLEALPQSFVLGASRFVRYKSLDRVIAAAELADLPVVIAGRGPEENHLRELAAAARVPAHIVHSPSDSLLWALYRRAMVLAFPAVEDFGIVPVEAQILGTPVVTGPVGGQVESVCDGVTGVISESTRPEHLADAIYEAIELPAFDGGAVTAKFSADRFRSEIAAFVGR